MLQVARQVRTGPTTRKLLVDVLLVAISPTAVLQHSDTNLALHKIALLALAAPPVLTRHAVAALDDPGMVPRLSWWSAFTHTLPSSHARRAQAWLGVLFLILVVIGAWAKLGLDLVHDEDPKVWRQGAHLDTGAYLKDHKLIDPIVNISSRGGHLIWRPHSKHPVVLEGLPTLYALNYDILDANATVHLARLRRLQVLDSYETLSFVAERTGLLALLMMLAVATSLGVRPIRYLNCHALMEQPMLSLSPGRSRSLSAGSSLHT